MRSKLAFMKNLLKYNNDSKFSMHSAANSSAKSHVFMSTVSNQYMVSIFLKAVHHIG